MKRITALLLALVMVLGLAPAALAVQVSDQQIIDAAVKHICSHEGNYGSINPNDNGSLSVGQIQWHGNNALDLLRDVVKRNPAQAQTILGEELCSEILDPATDWTYRIVETAEEKAALSKILTTPEGKAAQDDFTAQYLTNYLKRAKALGITDPAVLVFFCDSYNQGPVMTLRFTAAAAETAGSYEAITLDQIYQASMEDSVASKYPALRNAAYNYCKSLGWALTAPAPAPDNGVHFPKLYPYEQGMFRDVRANAWYTKNVAAAVEIGLMRGQGNGIFAPTGKVTIAEAITMAARIHATYYTGSAHFGQHTGANWYQVYLDYAYQHGILTSSYYRTIVNQPATRAQFAEIFGKALPAEALPAINTVKDNAIPDVPITASYAWAVYPLYRAGILTGNETNRFQPNSTITRAEAAAMAARMGNSDLRASVTLT